jgi:CDP-diacylglycerol--glycerol-3-phosphate 3-phosphatidyltransferase
VTWTSPNALTGIRIALIPLIVYLLTEEGKLVSALAGMLFLLACLTDFFDGYLARKRKATSLVGKFLDPLADKLIVMSVLVMLVAIPRPDRVPAWLVVVILGREFGITGLRGIALGEGMVLEAEALGKYKMILQVFAIVGLVVHYQYFSIDFHLAGMLFLWVSAFVSLWSAVEYVRRFIACIREKEQLKSTRIASRELSD